MPTPEEYEARIAKLNAELDRLVQKVRESEVALLSVAEVKRSLLPPSSFTIVGLEEFVLLIDKDGLIRYANTGMARLLGAKSKKELLKSELSQWDKGILGAGFLQVFANEARHSKQTHVVERKVKGLQLPTEEEAEHGRDATLRIVANSIEDQVQIVIQDITELRWLECSFSRYVSHQVIDKLRLVAHDALMSVNRKSVSVLFTDLRAFTSMSQEMEPSDVCAFLNEYFERLVESVNNYEGMVDKFVGDGLIAVFGAPLEHEDYALRALLAAREMQSAYSELAKERSNKGFPAPGLGIGIATGDVVVGNVGTIDRMDYTVIGHTVNLASRLCGAAKGGEILTEPETYIRAHEMISDTEFKAEMPRMSFEPVGKIKLKNIDESVDVIQMIVRDSK
ncbi:adenylate/guanylate cyclase domain-containing protein [bacterium]|nr:adenylate/guanylate cyclase domain-containing protein [bacterium]